MTNNNIQIKTQIEQHKYDSKGDSDENKDKVPGLQKQGSCGYTFEHDDDNDGGGMMPLNEQKRIDLNNDYNSSDNGNESKDGGQRTHN